MISRTGARGSRRPVSLRETGPSPQPLSQRERGPENLFLLPSPRGRGVGGEGPGLRRRPGRPGRIPVLRVLGLLFLLLSSTSCRKTSSIGSDIVATIEGTDIGYAHFESYLRENVDAPDLPLGNKVLSQLFDQFLDEQLLVRLALDHGYKSRTESAATPSLDQRLAVTYLLTQAAPAYDLQAEVLAYYEKHQDEYLRPESVRLRQILVHDRLLAEEALQALESGEDFAQVASRYSQVPMAHLGGEQGRLAREDLPESFADSIFALQAGEVSDILAADYGFHIFQVVERFPAEEVPLEEASEEIEQRLERRHVDELLATFIAEARGRYNVRIHTSNLPFDYQGSYAHEKDL